jgi:hypothetical protein
VSENENNSEVQNETDTDSCDQSRRNAIRKMGKYAAYTAPAMLTLLASKQSMAGGSMTL